MGNAKARQSVTSRLRKMVREVLAEEQVPTTIHATVTAVTGNTVSIKQQGSSTVTTGVHLQASYSPTVNDVVVCFNIAGDLWVLGDFA